MDKQRLFLLIEKYIEGTALPAERAELLAWYHHVNELEADWETAEPGGEELLRAAMLSNILHAIEPTGKKRRLWPLIAAAASVLAFLSFGYLFLHQQPVQKQTDIAPGGNIAILSFNGKQIVLNTTKNGIVAGRGNLTVTKQADGRLAYAGRGEASYDTLTTPRGGTYQLTLADGSKIWLNAATSIRYHSSFNGDKFRTVALLYGEAYYEVKHDPKQPFRVVIGGQTITDIGTHFDVSAYGDEPVVRTTLLEGGVQIALGKGFKNLVPGQQSFIVKGSQDIRVGDADTEQTVAWKNGYFEFNNENLESILREVSRWYNVDIRYDDNGLKSQLFSGTVSRFKNVSQVLKKLELTGAVHFQVNGREIVATH